ncbi:MAG: glycosyltransferase [Lacipirellulaceae bacterium]
MRIDHINTLATGGAAVAAMRLHESLCAAGVESRFWYRPPRRDRKRGANLQKLAASEELRWTKPEPSFWGRLKSRVRYRWQRINLKRSLKGRPHGLEIFTLPNQAETTPVDFDARGTDVIHLHWIANFVDYESFFASIDDQTPIVWTLHDMNPLTGGCHHADACEEYKQSCSVCPQMGPAALPRLVPEAWKTKVDSLAGKNLHLVAPSRWMEQCARASSIGQQANSIQTIPHGLDLEVFKPSEKHSAKQRLGIPTDEPTIGCGAASLRNPRKGFQDLLAAVAKVKHEGPIHLIAFGNATKDVALPTGVQLHPLGVIESTTQLAKAYSAMDVFAQPSRAESFGLVSVEAMACGVPVVAYDTTAVPEYVLPGQTGLLSQLGDVAGLADDLQWMLDNQEARQRMSQAARQFVLEHFDQRVQTPRYAELYRALVAQSAETRAA